MKKQAKKQKTLVLNKVQIMKMSEMKMVNGGNSAQADFNLSRNQPPTVHETVYNL